jgi:hypothetical protein
MESGKGVLDGKPVESVHYRLDAANVLIDLDCRKGDGALLDAAGADPVGAVRTQGLHRCRHALPPKPPPTRRETSTVVKGPAGDLAAVLTVPASKKPVPAVLMLSGSGPNDRDRDDRPEQALPRSGPPARRPRIADAPLRQADRHPQGRVEGVHDPGTSTSWTRSRR